MSIQTEQDKILSLLKCVRCGVQEVNFSQLRIKGVPVCENCKKRFRYWGFTRVLLLITIPIQVILLGVFFVLLGLYTIGLSIYGADHFATEWFGIWLLEATPFAIIFAVVVFFIFRLRRIHGSNLKNYLKYDKGFCVKSESEWLPYEDWVKRVLIEKQVSADDLRPFILKQTQQHQVIKKIYLRIGKILRRIGFIFVFVGITEAVNALGVILFWDFGAKFYLIAHLSFAVPFLLIGSLICIYGSHKKKFMELKEKKISSKVYEYYRDRKRL